jgi:hypothetical protein
MRIVILVVALLSLPVFATEMEMVEIEAPRTNRFSAGAGVEGRAREEINPEVKEGRALPVFFAQYRLGEFGAVVEGGYDHKETAAGGLSIETQTYQLGFWGRYEFAEPLRWSPFAGVGAGYFFDEVTSSFESESDTRDGRRGFMGVGGGVSHAAFKHLLLEAEMRAAFVQDRKDASYSAILRVGFVL